MRKLPAGRLRPALGMLVMLIVTACRSDQIAGITMPVAQSRSTVLRDATPNELADGMARAIAGGRLFQLSEGHGATTSIQASSASGLSFDVSASSDSAFCQLGGDACGYSNAYINSYTNVFNASGGTLAENGKTAYLMLDGTAIVVPLGLTFPSEDFFGCNRLTDSCTAGVTMTTDCANYSTLGKVASAHSATFLGRTPLFGATSASDRCGPSGGFSGSGGGSGTCTEDYLTFSVYNGVDQDWESNSATLTICDEGY